MRISQVLLGRLDDYLLGCLCEVYAKTNLDFAVITAGTLANLWSCKIYNSG